MTKFHFVEDYERHVTKLLEQHSEDEAMSLAVGGSYAEFGAIEGDILAYGGLKHGMSVIDIGCGSGRLASVLKARGFGIDYLGTDVVQSLLDYAAKKSPGYRFKLHRQLSIPARDASADIISAFSVFTHLLHHETFIYMEEAKRALKPGGKLIFSFLEFAEPGHWSVFSATVEAQRASSVPHLNTFIERNMITIWAARLGFGEPLFFDAGQVPGAAPLGQSLAILMS